MAYTDEQLAGFLRRAGVGAADAAYLVAIAHPESGASNVIQQGQPYSTTGWGIWQITPGNSEPSIGVNNALLNPETNARAAAAKLKSQGLNAWTTFTGGLYKPYFPAAQSATAKVYGMSAGQLSQLLAHTGSGGSSGNAPPGGKTGGGPGGIDWQGILTAPGLAAPGWSFIGHLIPVWQGASGIGTSLASISNAIAEIAHVAELFDKFLFWLSQEGGIYRMILYFLGFGMIGGGIYLFATGHTPIADLPKPDVVPIPV